MSGPSDQPDSCPACGAASLSYQEPIESWLCDECSYVVDSDSVPTDTCEPSGVVDDTSQNRGVRSSRLGVTDRREGQNLSRISSTHSRERKRSLVNYCSTKDQVIRSGELIAKAWQTNFMHGRSQERTIGAVVYAVSREADWALPPAMIAEVVEADKGAIKQTFQKLNRDLDLDIDPPVPSEFVTAIISKLEIPAKIEPVTKHKLRQYDASGSNPIGIAAAGVYITCIQTGVNITLVDLAQVVGLTKETIWRQKKTLLEE